MSSTIFRNTFCTEPVMAQYANTAMLGFLSALKESDSPSVDEKDSHARIRETTSHFGKEAGILLDKNSSDFIKLTGWFKTMAMWLNKLEAAGKNLAISPDSPLDLMEAARMMGCLQVWNQALGVLLPKAGTGVVD